MKRKLKIFLKNNDDENIAPKVQQKLDELENFITENCASKNAEIIKQHFSEMENLDGNFCHLNLWKLRPFDPPMGK